MRLAVPAAVRITRTPTPVDPVNETIDTSGCPIRCSPATLPAPVITLTTPGGNPASTQHWRR